MKSAKRFLFLTAWWILPGLPAAAAMLRVWQQSPSPETPYDTWRTAAHTIQDAVDAAAAGDTVLVTNGVYATGGKAVWGDLTNRVAIAKPIRVESVNGPLVTAIQGAKASGGGAGSGAIRCAYVGTNAVLSGFTLTNGASLTAEDSNMYGGGATCAATAILTNCVLTGNTAWAAGGAVYAGTLHRCTLTNNVAGSGGGAHSCTLYDCTLSRNVARWDGGGGSAVSTLFNCMLISNSAPGSRGGGANGRDLYHCTLIGNSADQGGGTSSATLYHCTLTGNWALSWGGGAYWSTAYSSILTSNAAPLGGAARTSTLVNCTLVGNLATNQGGAVYSCSVDNSIAYFNTAPDGPNFFQEPWAGAINHCSTTPLPPNGFGNITNEPAFVDLPNGNLRLQPDSPCINAGNNGSAATTNDLVGNPRIVSGAVDMGAYEYQGPGSLISYAWLQQYGLPHDGSADFDDADDDRRNNWEEWVAGTHPTDAQSCFLVEALIGGPMPGVTVSSRPDRLYTLLRCTELSAPVWWPVPGQSDLPGTGGPLPLDDPDPPSPVFYRVSVRLP